MITHDFPSIFQTLRPTSSLRPTKKWRRIKANWWADNPFIDNIIVICFTFLHSQIVSIFLFVYKLQFSWEPQTVSLILWLILKLFSSNPLICLTQCRQFSFNICLLTSSWKQEFGNWTDFCRHFKIWDTCMKQKNVESFPASDNRSYSAISEKVWMNDTFLETFKQKMLR